MWSTKEQLCLVSAVVKNADKNWTSVGKCLKELFGNDGKPLDWYSNANCIEQYHCLLDNMETIKKKKRSNENLETVEVDVFTDILLAKLAEERMKQLKEEVKKEQEEYAKLMKEIRLMETGEVTEEQLLEMWKEAQDENVDVPSVKEELKSDTTSMDMDVDETLSGITTSSIKMPTPVTGASPLLTSLLKSPTTTIPPQNFPTSSSARVTAPTITTLLTSGSIPTTNQPTITLKSHYTAEAAAQLLTRPITGPPVDRVVAATANSKSILSPSQTAPTLSMLLEKSKSQPSSISANNSSIKKEIIMIENKNESQKPQSSKTEEIQDQQSDNVKPKTPPMDSDDLNDEQQLLDVFENIGNLDELVADVAAVINEQGVEDVMESIMDPKPEIEKKPVKVVEQNIPLLEETPSNMNDNSKNECKIDNVKIENTEIEAIKAENSTSDDSNDNLPLATVASLEKEHSIEKKEKPSEDHQLYTSSSSSKEIEKKSPPNEEEEIVKEEEDEVEREEQEEEKPAKSPEVEKKVEPKKEEEKDVFAIPDDFDDTYETPKFRESTQISNLRKILKEDKIFKEKQEALDQCDKEDPEESKIKLDFDKAPSPTIEGKSITDSDEDEEPSKENLGISSKENEVFEVFDKTEDSKASLEENEQNFESSTQESLPISTPVKPPVLRKLRDRDRSESPLVDEDTNASDHSTTNIKSNQRSSLTPNMDSIPSSPVNSITSSEHEERRETRETRGTSKKSLLNVYNSLQPHKHIGTFQRIFEHENYQEICNNPMDLVTIKKNIESGSIKSLSELQRDVLLMCTNAVMISKFGSSNYKAALAFKNEVQTMKEFNVSPANNETKDLRTSLASSCHSIVTSKRGRKKNSL